MGIVVGIIAICIKVVDSRVDAMWHIEYITKVKSKFKSLD
jgi:type IV secretory pathway VirB2 component (pilin)